MQLYTKYFDDDDEEQRFNLGAMSRFAGQPEPSYDGGAPPEPEQPSPDMEGLATAQRNNPAQLGTGNGGYPDPRMLEDDAIRAVRDSYGKKRGFFEDAAPAAIALGLDALLNKSRGAGAIVGGYAQGVQRRDMDDRNSMREMAQLEIQRAREAQQDQFRSQANEINQGNLKARNEENALARARFEASKGDPAVDRAYKQALTNEAEARAYAQWTKDPSALTPEQQAMNEDRDAMRQIRKDEIDARNSDRDEQRKMRLAMTNQTNFDKWKAAKETRDKEDRLATESFNEKSKQTRDLARTVQGMEATMSKYTNDKNGNPLKDDQVDIPGVGQVESGWLGNIDRKWVPDALHLDSDRRNDAIKMDEARRQANQTYKVIKTGLAAPIAEAEDIAMANGFAEGASEKQFREGMKVLSDVTKRELRARASASPVNARRALQAEGLADWVGGWGPDSEEQPYPEFKPLSLDEPSQRGSIMESSHEEGPVSSAYGGPAAGDVLQTTGQRPGEVPRVDDYLKRLQQNTRTPGVRYRP